MMTEDEFGWLVAERDLAIEERDEALARLEKLKGSGTQVVVDFTKSRETRERLKEELRIEVRKEFEDQLAKSRSALMQAKAALKQLQEEKK